MASRYGGITGSKRISEDFQNINTAFENVQTEMDANKAVVDNHLSSTTAHKAENITYSGEVPGSNVKQAIDGLDTRIDNIVAQSGDDITEIVDARGGYPVLGDRLNASDEQFTDLSYNVKAFGAKGDGVTDDTAAIQAALDSTATKIYFPAGKYLITSPLFLRRRGVCIEGPNASQNDDSGANEYTGAAIYKMNNATRTFTGINQDGDPETHTVNAHLIIAIENGYGAPYWAHGTRVKNLGFFGGENSQDKPVAIFGYRVPNSTFENIIAKYVSYGFQGYDCWRARWVAYQVWYADVCGFKSVSATSNHLDNCYVSDAPVSYILNNTYSQLSNCASDHAVEIAYWIQGGQCTMSACGEEGSKGVKVLSGFNGSANGVVNLVGFYPNTTDELVRTTEFKTVETNWINPVILQYNYFGYGEINITGMRSRASDERGASFIHNENVNFINSSYPGTLGMPNETKSVNYTEQWEYHDVMLNDGSASGGAIVGKAYVGYDGHFKHIIFDIDIDPNVVTAWGSTGWILRDNYGANYGVDRQDKNNQYADGGQKKIYYTFGSGMFPYNLINFFNQFDFVVYDKSAGTNSGKNINYYVRYNTNTRSFELSEVSSQSVVNPATTIGGANKKLLIIGKLPNWA